LGKEYLENPETLENTNLKRICVEFSDDRMTITVMLSAIICEIEFIIEVH